MGRVVGANHVDDPRIQRLPQGLPVACVPDGRIHLRIGAQAFVAIGRFQRQMLGRYFDRGEVLRRRQHFHFFRRGDVEHMDAPPGSFRQTEQAFRCQTCAFCVAPNWMLADSATILNQFLAGDEPGLIFRMHRHAPPPVREHTSDIAVLRHQKRALSNCP